MDLLVTILRYKSIAKHAKCIALQSTISIKSLVSASPSNRWSATHSMVLSATNSKKTMNLAEIRWPTPTLEMNGIPVNMVSLMATTRTRSEIRLKHVSMLSSSALKPNSSNNISLLITQRATSQMRTVIRRSGKLSDVSAI